MPRRIALVLFALSPALGWAQSEYDVMVLSGSLGPTSFARAVSGGKIVGSTGESNFSHALVWNNFQPTDLHPDGFHTSFALGTSDGIHVGLGYRGDDASGIIWHSDNANDITVVTDPRYTGLYFYNIDGGQIVGLGVINNSPSVYHAVLWQNGNLTDLHPGGGPYASAVHAVHNGSQAGYTVTSATVYAALWHGTAESYTSLHPKGYDQSSVRGIFGDTQVGSAGGHAFLWHGSATDYVDLNPPGWANSIAYETNGARQVGYGFFLGASGVHALTWAGSAASFMDLHPFVPASFDESFALSIDESGTIVGYGFDNSTGTYRGLVWTPVPEPASLLVTACGLLLFACRRTGRA